MTHSPTQHASEHQPSVAWSDWRLFWLWWVLVNGVGWSISLAAQYIGLLLIGFIIGLAQWFLLRYYLPNARVWVLATGLGLGLALPLSMAFFSVTNPDRAVAAGAVTGVVVGFAQRMVLYRSVPDSRWWTLASVVGTTVGLYVGMALYYGPLGAAQNFINNSIAGLLIGMVYGAITGVAMVWLLRKMPAEEEAFESE